MTAAPILSLKQASKHYRAAGQDIIALDHVSLDIEVGQMTGIVGPSGSGKTTLLMIAGLIELPTTGEVWLDGLAMHAARADAGLLAELRRSNFGFVFQKPNLVPFLNARENVQVALKVAGIPEDEARERADELLEQLGVWHRAESMPHQMSGGEQQRVAISRALANRPRLVFADEPTASLDSDRARQVIDLFEELSLRENVGVVMVTHDARWLRHFQTIHTIEDGRLVSCQRRNLI